MTDQVEIYLLNAIINMNDDGPMSIDEAIKYCKDRFTSEFQHVIDRNGEHAAMEDWLRGMAIDIECWNHDVLTLAVKWGSLPLSATEAQEDDMLDGYWPLMATKLLELLNAGETIV